MLLNHGYGSLPREKDIREFRKLKLANKAQLGK
jgi:hypothetical protein